MFTPTKPPASPIKARVKTKIERVKSSAYVGPSIFELEAATGQLLTPVVDSRIHHIGLYNPTQRRCKRLLQDNYQPSKQFTALVKSLKNKKPEAAAEHAAAIEYFSTLLSFLVTNGNQSEKIIICSVPTSTPDEIHLHGPTRIASDLARYNHHIDGTELVFRTEAKLPCHKGGARTAAEVVKGLFVNAEAIRGKAVLLIDDVVTTGSNMFELYKILIECGATRVVCLALGCTLINRNINNNRPSVLERFILGEIENIETDPSKQAMFNGLYKSLRRAFPLSPLESPSQPQYVPFMHLKRSQAARDYSCRLDFNNIVPSPAPLPRAPRLESISQASSPSFSLLSLFKDYDSDGAFDFRPLRRSLDDISRQLDSDDSEAEEDVHSVNSDDFKDSPQIVKPTSKHTTVEPINGNAKRIRRTVA